MGWLEFFSGSLDALAWPVVTLIIALNFKDKIGELLSNLKRFKHKDTEIEFQQRLEESLKESSSSPEIQNSIQIADQSQLDEFNFIRKLGEISPRSAVLEAWRKVEVAAVLAAVRTGFSDSNRGAPGYGWLRTFEKSLNVEERRTLDNLRKLRNLAAHSDDFMMQEISIDAYIDLALSMASRIERISKPL